jgi:N,N'-diacetylchitobiose transport system permease protein
MPATAIGRTERLIPPAPSYRRRARRALRRQLLPFLLLLPALVLVGGVLGYPIGQLVATSFQQLGLFELIGHRVVWNGLTNYRTVFASSQFLDSLEQTALFVLATVGLTMLIGTGVALLMGRLGKILRTVVSVAMLLAWAMPSSAASIVWSWMFETEYGVVNYIAVSLGLHGFNNHDWFASALSAYSVVTAMIVWQAVPFVALSLYAALTLVPQELFEAAAIDGASPATIFRRVTFPLVRPIFVLLTVLSVIWDGNVFNQVWYLTAGRAQVINVIPLGVWQYIEAFSSQQYGLGAAVAVVTVVVLLLVTGYYIRIMVRMGETRA